MYQKTYSIDGNLYDSRFESKVADFLFMNGVIYERHKKLPKPSRQICDFYLPKQDLWIEVDGLMEVRADNRLIKKKKFYEDHHLKYICINRDNWEITLFNVIYR